MKNLILLLFVLFLNLSLLAQNTFQDFIKLFPNYTWSNIPEDIRNLKKGNLLDIDKANDHIWGSHASISKATIGYTYKTRAPHIMNQDGLYVKGSEGIFNKKTISGDTGAISTLQPLGKVQINSNIVMLLLFYRFWDLETGWVEFYEAYTYRLTDEQLISSLCLWKNNREDLCISFKKEDQSFCRYETRYHLIKKDNDETEEESTIYKVVYKLLNDGYFQQTESADVLKQDIIYWAKINDDDNGRESPNVDSPILYKVLKKDFILVEKLDNSDWRKVIFYVDKDHEYHNGYIHKSRLVKVN